MGTTVILSLCIGTFSGVKDDYGNDTVPPIPLAVDRVMENRPFKSTIGPLQLPYETLSFNLSYIDPTALPSIALVNSDCRQLARSSQFRSVCFNYSYGAQALIMQLLQEGILREKF